jgi:hypothetical protein
MSFRRQERCAKMMSPGGNLTALAGMPSNQKVNKAEEQAIEISYPKNAHWELGLLNQWRYNQVQKLMLHRCLLNFSLGLCGLILLSNF